MENSEPNLSEETKQRSSIKETSSIKKRLKIIVRVLVYLLLAYFIPYGSYRVVQYIDANIIHVAPVVAVPIYCIAILVIPCLAMIDTCKVLSKTKDVLGYYDHEYNGF